MSHLCCSVPRRACQADGHKVCWLQMRKHAVQHVLRQKQLYSRKSDLHKRAELRTRHPSGGWASRTKMKYDDDALARPDMQALLHK